MSANMQPRRIDFTSLPDDILLEIARDCLLPKTNRHEIREYPHSNQLDFDLLAVNRRGRAALLTILRSEVLYIEVKYHECAHRVNTDPREAYAADRRILGEGTHAGLDDVFGAPRYHPALALRQAGHNVHAIQINIRCSELCQKTRESIVAFVPAQKHHILALCPILQRMQKPTDARLDVGYIEMLTDRVDTSYPQIREQLREAVDLIPSILPGVCQGVLTPAFVADANEFFTNYFACEIDTESWPILEPFLQRYLTELETSIASGTPIHELAGLAENFLGNKLYPNYGDHGRDLNIDNETFLSIFSIFNRYQCIFMDGLAEYLLRREATLVGQDHNVLDAICNEVHFMWAYFNRTMNTNMRWAQRVCENWTSPENNTRPCKEGLSLLLQCAASRLAEIRLKFAMARARRSQPSLRHYQELCVISRMATPSHPWANTLMIGQQLNQCVQAVRTLITAIRIVIQVYSVETPELNTMWAKAEELLTIITLEAGRNPYQLHDWFGAAAIDRRPVLRVPASQYEVLQVEPTNAVLSLIDEMRRRGLFAPVN